MVSWEAGIVDRKQWKYPRYARRRIEEIRLMLAHPSLVSTTNFPIGSTVPFQPDTVLSIDFSQRIATSCLKACDRVGYRAVRYLKVDL